MKIVSRLLIGIGLLVTLYAGINLYNNHMGTRATTEEAYAMITEHQEDMDTEPFDVMGYEVSYGDVFGIFRIPKLEREIGIIEGSDEDALREGVGHVESTVLPGQGEQIVLSGHRDGVFSDFGDVGVGDTFVVEMPYGSYTYEVKNTEIVDKYDTSVIREMGEEVLVVSTCYPFGYFGAAPERYVLYAYPVTNG